MIYSISTQFNLIYTVAKAVTTRFHKSITAFCITIAVSLYASSAYAEAGKTVLVLDASGSMWGQISDGYKIHVARNVVNNLLDTLPADQEIGLVAYGHRRTKDCSDIELLVPAVAGSREAITAAIETLNPTGRTPLSAAVIEAADELGSDATDATVILISDGEETCSMDPCAVSFELEKRGIDFIAHVVGFDVEKSADKAQLQCLAENTGGLFFSASSESELTAALNKISLAMSEAARQVELKAAVLDHESTPVRTGIEWTLTPTSSTGDTATMAKSNLLSDENRTAEALQLDLEPDRYTLSVTRMLDGVTTSTDLDLTSGEDTQSVLMLPPKASIEGPITVTIGEVFDVDWQGPGGAGDLIAVANSLSPTAQILSVFSANGSNTTTMRAPTEDWVGPNETHDAIVVAEVGATESINETGAYLGNPAMLQMPTNPGNYELRYVLHQDRKVLASRPITVVDDGMKLTAPSEAGAGFIVNIDWVGPGVQHDAIVVAEVGATQPINKAGTYLGNPAKVQMPTKPGEYELRYILHNGSTTMATRRINVIDGGISIDAPEQALAGDSVSIDWIGPGAQHDAITVAQIGATEHINETGTYLGNPATLQMPAKPGNYEIRYVLHNGGTTMASRPIKVVDAGVNLGAPVEASVGETIVVHWTGPNEPNDAIAVAEVGAANNLNTTDTYLGNPTNLQMPAKPGNYELRYVLHQGQTVMASQPITVNDADVLLIAPGKANTGDSIAVHWVGPDEQYDVIAVARVGDTEHINETSTDNGHRLELQMPTTAGNYELRYVLHQGRTTLATRPITVGNTELVIDSLNETSVGESDVVK